MPKIVPRFGETKHARHRYVRVDLGAHRAAADIGKAAGLTQFGVHLETLHPGARSSVRHWHEAEDEFVYVISGELVLIEDEETVLRAGEAAGWAAGVPVGHCLENRSAEDATILTVGTRDPGDRWHYVEHGITGTYDDASETFSYTDAAGNPIERETP